VVSGERIDTRGLTLRQFAARGVIVNSAFDVALGAVGLLRGLALAALISRADYGVWGILAASLGVLANLKLIGISDKYVQQDEADQELAFQRAFTLELAVSLATMVIVALAVPLVALVYGHWLLLAPGLALTTILLADALQSPMWIAYRRMEFVRQRLQAGVEPLVGLVVAVGLAVAGLGYWSLVIGAIAGAWAAALVAIAMSPYRLRLRLDRGSARVYASFSGPILLATLASIVLANGATLATDLHIGLAGVGAVALAGNITAFTTRVDDLVAWTIYPAICAVQDELDLLRESFVKSNRLALLWAMPFGIGIALFAHDLIVFVLGARWQAASTLLAITGAVAALAHIGFNWDDYFRARGQTRPVMVVTVLSAAATLVAAIPLLLLDGLTGLAIGIAAGALVNLLLRARYIRRLFPGFGFAAHAWRAVLPTLPAVVVVLALRALLPGPGTRLAAVLELAAYLVCVLAGSAVFERQLIGEAIGYAARRAG
jgi:PST family polysaccharide transporter